MKANQKGFSIVEILIVIVVVGLVAAAGWLVYDRQKAKASIESTNSQVSTQQKEETPKYVSKKVGTSEGQIEMKEWGLKFKIPSGLADVEYKIHDDTAAFFAKPA